MLQKFAVPFAIVIAGALIAGALYFASGNGGTPDPNAGTGTVQEEIRGVQANDHIRGNPNAEIVIVEYSDTECPFCKQYHETMNRIIDEYGADGKVAWVYRHFPLDQLHPKARAEAQASECVASIGGEDAFWKFINRIYEVTPANNGLDAAQLPVIASYAGVDTAAFESCMKTDTGKERIQTDIDEVVAAGGRGTPHSIVLVDGEQVPIEGAQPYEVIKGLIDTLLAQ